MPSAWMPPDVDEKVPAVEPGVPCRLDSVLHRTSLRTQELICNLDRFTATESLIHEEFTPDGQPAAKELRTFASAAPRPAAPSPPVKQQSPPQP